MWRGDKRRGKDLGILEDLCLVQPEDSATRHLLGQLYLKEERFEEAYIEFAIMTGLDAVRGEDVSRSLRLLDLLEEKLPN